MPLSHSENLLIQQHPHRLLKRREKARARDRVRALWMKSHDAEQAEADFRSEFAHVEAIDPLLFSLLIELAIKLLAWWLKNNITEPSIIPMTGEPGYSGLELDGGDDD